MFFVLKLECVKYMRYLEALFTLQVLVEVIANFRGWLWTRNSRFSHPFILASAAFYYNKYLKVIHTSVFHCLVKHEFLNCGNINSNDSVIRTPKLAVTSCSLRFVSDESVSVRTISLRPRMTVRVVRVPRSRRILTHRGRSCECNRQSVYEPYEIALRPTVSLARETASLWLFEFSFNQ